MSSSIHNFLFSVTPKTRLLSSAQKSLLFHLLKSRNRQMCYKGEREKGIMYFLAKCSILYNNFDILNTPFNIEDRGKDNAEYSMCYDKKRPDLEKYCGIDFVFYHWPSASMSSFEEIKNGILLQSALPPTIDKIGWYGNIHSPASDVPEFHTRVLLKEIGDRHPELFDILQIPAHQINPSHRNYKSLPDLMAYKFLIDIGGNGYSGRLKLLLFSRRPLLIVDRNYIEFFHSSLEPYVHYIPVKMDLSDLIEQAWWVRNNYEKSLEIAENAYRFANEHFSEKKLLERVHYVYQNLKNNNQ